MRIKSFAYPFVLGSLVLAGCDKSEEAGAGDTHQHGSTEAAEPGASDETASAETASKTINVTADGDGFTPSRVVLQKGQDATLRFTRTTKDTCADKVVFPELKIEKELPVGEPVDIDVPTDQARELAFQCGMGMYKSAVVVN